MNGKDHELPSNGELCLCFPNRDRDALAAMVDLYGAELTAYIRRIVGNPDDAEELMVDAFVRLIRSKAEFANNAALRAYLFKIGKTHALRHLEKCRRDPMLVELVESLLESMGGNGQPETEVLRAEENRQLSEAMGKLKPEHRQVLQLLYFENMSYADAGLAMNKTVRQIDGLVYRAKASLRRKLEKEGYAYAYEME